MRSEQHSQENANMLSLDARCKPDRRHKEKCLVTDVQSVFILSLRMARTHYRVRSLYASFSWKPQRRGLRFKKLHAVSQKVYSVASPKVDERPKTWVSLDMVGQRYWALCVTEQLVER